jgi:uncharacterized protein (TIGR02270 family)
MTVIAQVVDQHVEEAAILWLRRDCAVEEPHFKLEDVAQLDGQLDAHLDGMRIAEADSPGAGWQACERELKWNGPGEVFPAAILAWESNDPERIERVMQAARKSHECFRVLVSSLGWLADEQAHPQIERLLAHADPFEQRVGIAACAVRGRYPGKVLDRAVASRDPFLQTRALAAVGELARHDLLPAAKLAIDSPAAEVRVAAAWSVARLTEDEAAIKALQEAAISPTRRSSRALQLLLCRMKPTAAAAWINELAKNGEHARTAVIAAGIVGVPDAIPWLLQLMATPALARVAGEAFTMITGVDPAAAKFEANWPQGFTAGPTEDPADDNVEMDLDENLPWPDAPKLAALWDKRRGDFESRTRHLCGRPLTDDWLEDVLRNGYQRQRAAAALELALRRPDQPLFNVRAPGQRQKVLLGLRLS